VPGLRRGFGVRRDWLDESGLAEYKPRCRVQIDVIDRNPLRLDTVQSPVCTEAPVTPETTVFAEIAATPVGAFPAFFHCYYSCPLSKATLLPDSISINGHKIYCTNVAVSPWLRMAHKRL
jgi:hypothetical protein